MMKHLKTYKIFESINLDLQDIFQEVSDRAIWVTKIWPDSQSQKWCVLIERVDQWEETDDNPITPPPIITESVKRAIDFMTEKGLPKHRIKFDDEKISLRKISTLEFYPDSYIKLEFWD